MTTLKFRYWLSLLSALLISASAYSQSVQYADTANMLLPYLRKTDTANLVGKYLRKSDTTLMLIPYLRKIDTSFMLSRYLRKTDTSFMLSRYLRKTDTLFMLSPYLRKTDTANLVGKYLRKSDTSQMLNGYLRSGNLPSLSGKMNYTDTLNMLLGYLRKGDTSQMLSGYLRSGNLPSISGKMNYTDTLNMLLGYLRRGDTSQMLSGYLRAGNLPSISGKMNYTDTLNMLLGYLRKGDTSQMLSGYARLGNIPLATSKVNYSDTALMLVPYLRKVDTTVMMSRYLRRTDTAFMISPYLRKTDTSFMLSPYLRKLDTALMLSRYLRRADTAIIVAPYLRKSDTSQMLSGYLRSGNLPSISGKMNYTDTLNMLLGYLRKGDTSQMLSGYLRSGNLPSISGKMNYADTLAMLQNYLRKTDTASLVAAYLRKSDTATMLKNYVNIAALPAAIAANTVVPSLQDVLNKGNVSSLAATVGSLKTNSPTLLLNNGADTAASLSFVRSLTGDKISGSGTAYNNYFGFHGFVPRFNSASSVQNGQIVDMGAYGIHYEGVTAMGGVTIGAAGYPLGFDAPTTLFVNTGTAYGYNWGLQVKSQSTGYTGSPNFDVTLGVKSFIGAGWNGSTKISAISSGTEIIAGEFNPGGIHSYYGLSSVGNAQIGGRANINGAVDNANYHLNVLGNGNFSGKINANSFVKTGGTNTQYLMADGSTSTASPSLLPGNGITGYLPKWTGASELGNSSLIESGSTLYLAPGEARRFLVPVGASYSLATPYYFAVDNPVNQVSGAGQPLDVYMGMRGDPSIGGGWSGRTIITAWGWGSTPLPGTDLIPSLGMGEGNHVAATFSTGGISTAYGISSKSASIGSGGASILGRLNVGNVADNSTLQLNVGGNATFTGNLAANSYVKAGGTNTQFLMADGSTSTVAPGFLPATGITGYLPKWTGVSDLGNSQIRDDGGGVILGNISKPYQLFIHTPSLGNNYGMATGLQIYGEASTGDPSWPLYNHSINFKAAGDLGGGWSSDMNFIIFNGVNPGGYKKVMTIHNYGINVNGEVLAKHVSANYIRVLGTTSGAIEFKAPSAAVANQSYTLPSSTGSNGQVLTTDGTGILNWTTGFTGAGTNGYLPKWTGANALANSSLFESTGNIGIGVLPSAWQTMTGLQVGEAGSFASKKFSAGNVQTMLGNNVFYDNTGFKYISSEAASMMRMVNNQFQFNIAGTGTASNLITFNQAMTLQSSGNLSLGTIADNGIDKLQVNGSANISGNVKSSSFVRVGGTASQYLMADGTVSTLPSFMGGSGTNNYISKFTSSGAIGNSLLFDNGTNVGIGTTSPNSKLDIDKSLQTNGGITPSGALLIANRAAGNGVLELGVNSSATSWLQSRNSISATYYALSLQPNGGNTLIGTTTNNGVDKLQVSGSVAISSNVTVGGSTGAAGVSVIPSMNYSFGEGSGLSYVNLFRQASTAASVLANGYKYSGTAGGFASSISSAWAKSAIAVGFNNGSISFFADPITTVANGTNITPTERMRITSAGNALIGTITDNGLDKLQVNGSGRFTTSLTANSFIKIGGTSTQYLMADGSVSTLPSFMGGSGTTNYISKFTSTGAIGNSQIFDNGTNVLINTTSDNGTDKLQVNGSILTGNSGIKFGSAATSIASDGSSLYLKSAGNTYLNTASNAYVTNAGGASFNGTVGIGGNSGMPVTAGGSLFISGGFASPDAGRILFGDGTGWKMHLSSRLNSVTTDLFTFQDNGNVNISGNATASRFVKAGGTASQYLMADGSVSTLPSYMGGSGMVNYIPKFNSSTGIGNSQIFDNGTNVGIGTTNNGGDGGVAPRLAIANPSNVDKFVGIGYDNAGDYGFIHAIHRANAWKNLIIQPFGGNVGIGTSSPARRLDVNGTSIFRDYTSVYSGNTIVSNITWLNANDGLFTLYSGGNGVINFNTNGNSWLNGGNVGIGTTSPSVKLDVNGTFRTTGIGANANPISAGTNPNYFRFLSSGSDFYVGTEGATGGAFFTGSSAYDNVLYSSTAQNFIIGGASRMRISSTGNVGIGSTNPAANLSIKSGSNVDAEINSLPDGISIQSYNRTSSAYGDISFVTNANGPSLLINNEGQVCIGCTTRKPAAYKLAVEGGIAARSLRITQANPWADYVFDKKYQLKPLDEVEKYIQQNHHLPDMPSAATVAAEGIDVADIQSKLLSKIEELTLYVIELKKEVDALKKNQPKKTKTNK